MHNGGAQVATTTVRRYIDPRKRNQPNSSIVCGVLLGLLLMAAPHQMMGQATSVPDEAHVTFAQITEQSAYLKGEWIGAPTALAGRQTSTISCALSTHNCHEVSATLIGDFLDADDNDYHITRWTAEELRASNNSPRWSPCQVTNEIVINRVTHSVRYITTVHSGDASCKAGAGTYELVDASWLMMHPRKK